MKAMLLFVAAIALGGCDPVWGVNARVRNPMSQPLDDATLALSCDAGAFPGFNQSKKTVQGSAFVGGIGTMFPAGCDVIVAKPGYRTLRVRYRDLCPTGATTCDRYYDFDLVLQPE